MFQRAVPLTVVGHVSKGVEAIQIGLSVSLDFASGPAFCLLLGSLGTKLGTGR